MIFSEALFGKVVEAEMYDPRPEYKLLHFTFYCESGHLVPFDREEFDERRHFIYGSGYIKPVFDDSLDLQVLVLRILIKITQF